MPTKSFYKDFYLSSISTRTDDGRFQARVAIMALSSTRTRSQRFLDLETFSTEAEADARSIAAAEEWVDSHSVDEGLSLPAVFGVRR